MICPIGLIYRLAVFSIQGILFHLESPRGPQDWGFRLLGKRREPMCRTFRRIFDGAGEGTTTRNRRQDGVSSGPLGSPQERVRGAFFFCSLVGVAPALLTSWTAKAEGCVPLPFTFYLYFLKMVVLVNARCITRSTVLYFCQRRFDMGTLAAL